MLRLTQQIKRKQRLQQCNKDYLIYNGLLGYEDLILNGGSEEYLKNATGSHGLED